jgi:uncharacterized protein YbcI
MGNTENPTIRDQAASVSNLVVRVTADFTGRGPMRAHTEINENSIHVVLEGLITTTERHLLAGGHRHLVLGVRRAIHAGMSDSLVAGVENITGRKVTAFLSADHFTPDVAVGTFILRRRNAGPV